MTPRSLSLRPPFPQNRARLADLYAAEWIKLWSLRSTPIALGLGVTLALYLAGSNSVHGTMLPSGLEGPIDPNRAAFDGPSWVLVMIGAGMIGAQSMVGEHASGLIRTTLAAIPDRRRVVVAKAAVVVSVMAVAALVGAVGGLILTHTVAPPHPGTSVDVPHAIGASIVVLPVCALAGMAFGTLLRHATATGFVVCAVLGFGPLLLRPDGNRWATGLANAMPYYSWGRLTGAGATSSGTMTVPMAWTTLAAWAAVSILVTTVVLDRRDV